MFTAKFVLHNKTQDLNIQISRDPIGKVRLLKPNESYITTVSGDNNFCISHALLTNEGNQIMHGQTRFGANIGVNVERGWIYDGDDTIIKMIATANGKEFIQTTNGGRPILTPGEFLEGGEIVVNFQRQ